MFNDIIYISMKPHVSDTRYEEVEGEFKKDIGRRVQAKLRTRLDPGVTFRGHQAARSVKVELNKEGSLAITGNEPGKDVMKPKSEERPSAKVLDRSDTVNDLFSPGTGIPSVVESNGETRLAFRSVNDTELFTRRQEDQDAEIKRIVDNTIQMATVDAMEEAVKGTERRYPSEAIGSESIPEKPE
jgi:hypothetical protein